MNEKRQEFYANSYKQLQRSGIQGWGTSYFDRLIEKQVKRFDGMKILEVGAASGEHLRYVSLEPSWDSYVCIDICPGISDKTLFEQLSRKESPILPNVSFVSGNVEKMPFSDESFDLVVSTCLLAHVRDPESVLLEIRRVAKRNGQIVIGLPTDPGILNRLVKTIITYPKMKRLEIENPKLEYAREHINGINNLLELIKFCYGKDQLHLKYFPFAFRSWNLNLAVVADCRIDK